MFKNIFPNKILSLSNRSINRLMFLMGLILLLGIIYALFISPPDYIQGDYVRIPNSETISNLDQLTLECWYFQTGFGSPVVNFESCAAYRCITHFFLEMFSGL